MMKIMKNLVKRARLLIFCMAIFNSEAILLPKTCVGQTINYATTFEELNNAITNAQDDDIIYVSKNITVPSSFSNSASSTAYMVAKNRITIEGLGADVTIKREGGKSILECNGSGAVVSLRNLTFDGGAIWTSDVVSDVSNSGVSGRSVIDVAGGATLNLESGAIIQNGFTTDSSATNTTDAGSAAYGGGIRVDWKLPGGGTINVKAGSIIRNCKARKSTGSGYGGGIGAYNNANLNLYGGIIERCYASHGGAIGCTYRNGTSNTTAAVIKVYGGTLQNNAAIHGGALCCEGKTEHYINGGTIINNQASTRGGAIALIEADTIYLAAKGSSLVIENNSVSPNDASVDQFGYEGIYIDPRSTANTLIENKTVSFDTKGGNTFPDLTVEKGHSLGEAFPGNPIKLGYVFSGWFTDNGTFRNQFTSTTIVTEDTTVYAKWDIAPVQIISPVPNAVFDPGATVTILGTGVPGHTVKITEGIKILATTQVDPDGYWSTQLSGLPGGTHTVSVNQSDPYGSAFPAVPLSFKILKIPTLDLFNIILTEDLTYNGAVKQFVVTLKPNITGMGTFTVRYFRVNPDGTETELPGPPTDVGRYRAKIYIEKGSDYTAAVLRIVYFPKS